MTLKEIRDMFEPGQWWVATNTYCPKVDGPRCLDCKPVTVFTWTRAGKTLGTPFPKASAIIEARAGYLRFRLFEDKPGEVEYELAVNHEAAL